MSEKESCKVSHTRLSAKWLNVHGYRVCSNCGIELSDVDDSGDYIVANFCNNCGAKMENKK